MFKKTFKAQSTNKLKTSDKKKLRDTVKRVFPALKEDDLELLLPLKGDVCVSKISGTHTLIYSLDGEPLFIDTTGRNSLFPTVMALWRMPHMLPTITIYPPVFKYILSGAGANSIWSYWGQQIWCFLVWLFLKRALMVLDRFWKDKREVS